MVHVQTKEILAPSGHKYTIRLQNGEDDGLLSNYSDMASGRNYDRFIMAIVVKTDAFPSGVISEDNIDEVPTLDYAYIILASRAWSIGETVTFRYNWGKDGMHSYSEDLKPYLPDYSKALPKPGDPDFFPFHCPKYPLGKTKVVNLTLSSGKEVKYNILTRKGEKLLLEIPEKEHNINTKLIIRGLELKVTGVWYKVENFSQFSSKDMSELRNSLKENDPEFSAYSQIENPKTHEALLVRLLDFPDFFFPQEI